MFIPDPRWEEPNLLIPGKKPTGPVVIDWGHPLAEGLTCCTLFDSPRILTELVSGIPVPYVPSLRETLETVVNARGGRMTGRAYYSGADTHGDFRLPTGRKIYENVDGVSFAAGVKRVSSAKPFYTFSAGTRDLVGLESDDTFRAYVSNEAASLRLDWRIPLTISDGYCDIVMVRNSGTIVSAYRNGTEETPSVYDTGLGSGLATTSSSHILLTGTGYTGAGYYTYFYCWDRPLSDAEAASISANPYQFLIPQ